MSHTFRHTELIQEEKLKMILNLRLKTRYTLGVKNPIKQVRLDFSFLPIPFHFLLIAESLKTAIAIDQIIPQLCYFVDLLN